MTERGGGGCLSLKLSVSTQLCHFPPPSPPAVITAMGDEKQEQSKIQLQYLLESLTQNFLIICKNSSFLLIPETIALQTYQERTSARIFYLTFFF